MPVPSPRNKILPVRGNIATLQSNLGSLLEGEICYALDEDKLYVKESGVLVDVSGAGGGATGGGTRNVLINGNPMINQRGYVSGTATTGANEYTVDRWRVVTLGESITFSDSANVRTVTAPAGGVEQVIEGVNLLSDTYTLSWTGTATATVDGNPVTNGGQVTLTGGTNATVKFSGGTFSLAQLERGTVATPFEHRNYGDELALCQRYYYSTPSTAPLFGTMYNGSNAMHIVHLPATMRATPSTFTYSQVGGGSFSTNYLSAYHCTAYYLSVTASSINDISISAEL